VGLAGGRDPAAGRRRLRIVKTGFSLFFLGLGLVTLLAYVQLGIAHADRAGEPYVPGAPRARRHPACRRRSAWGALSMRIIYTDVLVVGGGLAGLRAAVGARRRGHEVIILSLVPPKRSHSAAAQGGMQASLGNTAKGAGDNEDVHFEDTVRGSDWGCDQEVARLFVHAAPRPCASWPPGACPGTGSRPASARW
jgi:hypothetical protein